MVFEKKFIDLEKYTSLSTFIIFVFLNWSQLTVLYDQNVKTKNRRVVFDSF